MQTAMAIRRTASVTTAQPGGGSAFLAAGLRTTSRISPSNTPVTGTASNSPRRPASPIARMRAASSEYRARRLFSSELRACTNAGFLGGGGAPFQNFRKDVDLFQVGASILHVPSGLWVYGLYQHEENNGTDVSVINNTLLGNAKTDVNDRLFNNHVGSEANDTDVWFAKGGIKRAWLPAGNTVIWGEGGQYLDQFAGLAGVDLCQESGEHLGGSPAAATPFGGGGVCFPHAEQNEHVFITSTTVNRWGAGIMQEIDSAAMHLWVNWQHLELNADLVGTDPDSPGSASPSVSTSRSRTWICSWRAA